MCLAPVRLNDENRTTVACRHCAICRQNRLNDLVGRALCEQTTAFSTVAVTLTYAGDVPSAAVLTYSDVQKFLKGLRKAGHEVRYICCGEYGSKKGRAHWHIILFFYGDEPEYSLDEKINWKFWPHGFSYFQRPDMNGFRYIMKYALKDIDDPNHTRKPTMSKKPPLGYQFFMDLARDHVEKRLAIYSPEYSFAGVKDSKGQTRKFWLQGRMRELFLERYCDLWRARYGEEPPYTDFLYEKYLDPIARDEMEAEKAAGDIVSPEQRRKDEAAARRQLLDDLLPRPIRYLSCGEYGTVVVLNDETAECRYGGMQWQLIAKEQGGRNVARVLRRIYGKDLARVLYGELNRIWQGSLGPS